MKSGTVFALPCKVTQKAKSAKDGGPFVVADLDLATWLVLLEGKDVSVYMGVVRNVIPGSPMLSLSLPCLLI